MARMTEQQGNVMPRIGSGLDRLDWATCKQYISNILVKNGINLDV